MGLSTLCLSPASVCGSQPWPVRKPVVLDPLQGHWLVRGCSGQRVQCPGRWVVVAVVRLGVGDLRVKAEEWFGAACGGKGEMSEWVLVGVPQDGGRVQPWQLTGCCHGNWARVAPGPLG